MGLVEQFLLENIEEGDLEGVSLQQRRGALLQLCLAPFSSDTAFHLAINCGNPAAVELLCILYPSDSQKLLSTSYNSLGYLAVHTACRRGEFECLQVLLDIKPELVNLPTADNRNAFPLHFVAEFCKGSKGAEMTQLMLEKGARVLAEAKSAITALNVAARHDNTDVLGVLLEALHGVDSLMKARGEGVCCSCVIGEGSVAARAESPLLSAVRGGAVRAAKDLIDRGFCIYQQVASGRTILDEARLAQDAHLADKLIAHSSATLSSSCKRLNRETNGYISSA